MLSYDNDINNLWCRENKWSLFVRSQENKGNDMFDPWSFRASIHMHEIDDIFFFKSGHMLESIKETDKIRRHMISD